MNIAIATSADYPELVGGEKLLLAELTKHGFTAQPVIWDDTTVAWEQFDAVVLRTCWGYYNQIPHFLDWLKQLEAAGVRVFNHPDIIRWNSHKSYLLDLAAKGLSIPQSLVTQQNDTRALKQVLHECNFGEAYVVKPCYGASAQGAFKTTPNTAPDHEAAYRALLEQGDILVQAFVTEITHGEISAIFIDNRYSHSVLKVPKAHDFRSNLEHGGSEMPISLDAKTIESLTSLYHACAVDTLYARLDVVRTKAGICIMELELIEPYLYFESDEQAPARFVRALAKRLM